MGTSPTVRPCHSWRVHRSSDASSPVVCLAPGNIEMRPGRRVSQLLNVAFDMAAWVGVLSAPSNSSLTSPSANQEILGSLSNGCTLCVRGKSSKEWRAVMKTVDIVIGECTAPYIMCYSLTYRDIFSDTEHDGYASSASVIDSNMALNCGVVLAPHDPADYPNIKVVATAGEPCPLRTCCAT